MQKPTAASFLANHAHYPWKNRPVSNSHRQPACWDSQPKPESQRSIADDIHAAKHAWKEHQKHKVSSQNGDIAPGAPGASQQQLEKLAQEFFKELAPESTSNTTLHMGYDELMDIDHKPASSNDSPVSDISGKSANNAKRCVQGQSHDPVKPPEPAPSEGPSASIHSDPKTFMNHGTLLQQATAAVLICTAGLAGLFVAWQVGKFLARCLMSLAYIHGWLMIMGLTVTALITPQAPKINGLLRFVDDYNLFANYGQAKHGISIATWSSIAFFLVLVFFAGSI